MSRTTSDGMQSTACVVALVGRHLENKCGQEVPSVCTRCHGYGMQAIATSCQVTMAKSSQHVLAYLGLAGEAERAASAPSPNESGLDMGLHKSQQHQTRVQARPPPRALQVHLIAPAMHTEFSAPIRGVLATCARVCKSPMSHTPGAPLVSKPCLAQPDSLSDAD